MVNFFTLFWCEKQLLRQSLPANAAKDIPATVNDRTALWAFWSSGAHLMVRELFIIINSAMIKD
ncbi:MAG TPA: hypothetical protein VKV04_00900 [Verrucomicrobiae bacterium]|nr:hypothetical protein [Verrucomicrobiae bacterium]